jgi:hypothetical protein
MATVVPSGSGPVFAREDRVFLWGGVAMVLVLVTGFSMQLAAGRSSFGAPLYVHAHALTFFGWTMLYLTQTLLATSGNIALHKRLGWIAAAWIPLMVVVGTMVAYLSLRRGHTAPIFTPAYFTVMAPLTVYTFAGLATAAILLRRRTDWHKRLQFCAMAGLMGPGFGRMLPMPLFIPYTPQVETASILVIPVIAALADWRRAGGLHRAWLWGIGTLLVVRIAIDLLGTSLVAAALYHWITAGSPGAALPPFAIPMMSGS